MARSDAPSAGLLLLAASLLLLSAVRRGGATDHIVGGHLGWNPNINYTLWANNQTFLVGDLISFRYLKNTYNVFEVNETGYDNCTMDGAVGNWSSGKDFIPLNHPGWYYFICGNGQCFSGMKVAVHVEPLPSPQSAPSSSSPHGNATEKSLGPVLRPIVLVTIVAAVAGWRGINWI